MRTIHAAAKVACLLAMGGLLHAAGPADWGGAYTGLELGYASVKGDWTTTKTYSPDGSSPAELFGGHTPSPTYDEMKKSKAHFGINGGYAWVVGSKWVVGPELSIGFANTSKSINFIPGLDPTPDTTPGHGMYATATVESKYSLALKFKGGYLLTDDAMLYATLGVARQKFEAQGQSPADTYVSDPEAGTQTFRSSESLNGVCFGFGFEYKLSDHFCGVVSYDYTKFREMEFVAMQYSSTAFGADAKIHPSTQKLSLGVVYRY